MSNCLQSEVRKGNSSFSCAAFAVALILSGCAQAEKPIHTNNASANVNPGTKNNLPETIQNSAGKMYVGAAKQFNQPDSAMESPSKSKDIGQTVVQKITDVAKQLIYDPEHPQKLFDLLIGGYSLVTEIEKQCIPYTEKLLGADNQLVAFAKKKLRGTSSLSRSDENPTKATN